MKTVIIVFYWLHSSVGVEKGLGNKNVFAIGGEIISILIIMQD